MINDSEPLEKKSSHDHLLRIKLINSLFKVIDAFGSDRMSIPVKFLLLVSVCQFTKASYQLAIAKIIIIIKIEKNLISRHALEIDEVVARNRLLLYLHGHLSCANLYCFSTLADITEPLRINYFRLGTIDLHLLMSREVELA